MRERDVRNAVKTALDATNAFDPEGVALTTLIDDTSTPLELQAVAYIGPYKSTLADQWDGAPEGLLIVDAMLRITFLYRDGDVKLRDEGCEALVNVASNALNGNSFGGLVMAQKSRLVSWEWHKTDTSTERFIVAVFAYSYFVDGWNDYDTTS